MRLFSDNPDFYPTPNEVISQMLLGEDIMGKVVLEPSAGSGNIVKYLKRNGARDVIACEKDPHCRMLLNGLCNIIAEDFLTVTPEQVSHVNYIVMNPPFSRGAEHILHAWEIAPPGCTVIALCNTSSVDKDSYYSRNQQLCEVIKLNGSKENLGSCFKNSERDTNVRVSLVKLFKEGEGEDEFAGYFFDQYDTDSFGGNTEGLMQYNFIRDIVGRYVSAVKLFDNVLKVSKEINEVADFFDYRPDTNTKGEPIQVKQTYGYLPVRFGAIVSRDEDSSGGTEITHDQYKKMLQRHYWHIIFQKLNMEKYATKQLREQINKFIEQQKQVPFTMGNIYKVIDIVVQTNGQRMQRALLEAFDLICSFSAENSTAGETWKTNANYMVNRKFIVPWICSTDSWYTCRRELKFNYSDQTSKLEDVAKGLCFLTGRNYDEIGRLEHTASKQNATWGEWFEWGFFRCKGHKKGTMHFEFLDEDVWYKFNAECARLRGWNLPKKSERKRKAKATTQQDLFT